MPVDNCAASRPSVRSPWRPKSAVSAGSPILASSWPGSAWSRANAPRARPRPAAPSPGPATAAPGGCSSRAPGPIVCRPGSAGPGRPRSARTQPGSAWRSPGDRLEGPGPALRALLPHAAGRPAEQCHHRCHRTRTGGFHLGHRVTGAHRTSIFHRHFTRAVSHGFRLFITVPVSRILNMRACIGRHQPS